MNIVELFSGSGHLSSLLKKHGHNVISIDYSNNSVADVHCDIRKLTFNDLCNLFPDHKVDFIFAAPSDICYFGKLSTEQLLWENILKEADKHNCLFIVEGGTFNIERNYRFGYKYECNYTNLNCSAWRLAWLWSNNSNWPNFADNFLKHYTKKTDEFITAFNQTPSEIIHCIDEFIVS